MEYIYVCEYNVVACRRGAELGYGTFTRVTFDDYYAGESSKMKINHLQMSRTNMSYDDLN